MRPLFLLQRHKFNNDNIEATLICTKCEQMFTKEFPVDLEGQITEFKCPICETSGEAELPYKPVDEREALEEDFVEFDEHDIEDSDQMYWNVLND